MQLRNTLFESDMPVDIQFQNIEFKLNFRSKKLKIFEYCSTHRLNIIKSTHSLHRERVAQNQHKSYQPLKGVMRRLVGGYNVVAIHKKSI